MELKEGKMTGQEIAEWMGISYDATYRRNPKKYLARLVDYCDYEQVRGGAIISNIKIPTYVKNLNNLDDKTYLEILQPCLEQQEGLATITGIVETIIDKAEYKNLSENQIRYRMTKSGKRLFGETANTDSKGVVGWREYCWAVKLNGINKYRFMTAEEHEKFKEITLRYYKKDFESIQKEALIKDAYKKGEIDEVEFAYAMSEFDYFTVVIKAVEEELNIRIARATRHEVENSEYFNFMRKNNEAE